VPTDQGFHFIRSASATPPVLHALTPQDGSSSSSLTSIKIWLLTSPQPEKRKVAGSIPALATSEAKSASILTRRTVARTGAGENGIRAILRRNRKHELDPWRIPGGEPDEFEAALDAGEAIVVDSATLWIAFQRAGIPNADFARHELGGRLDARFWFVSEAGEVSEWSEDYVDTGEAGA
jgi:hypothetical protein